MSEVLISRKTAAGWQHASVGTFAVYAMDVDASGKVHVVAKDDTKVVYFRE